MWQFFIGIIKTRAPQAVLVFDRFHIVQHLSRAVAQVRRDKFREKGAQQRTLMAKTRYIWLKNRWNPTERQREHLSELERLKLKINRAYLPKEASKSCRIRARRSSPDSISITGSGGPPTRGGHPCATLLGC
jgi:transposase